ncbi:MAG: helix-turn-helix transcriptional regulator [Acidobacteriota bacterium]
MMRFEGRVWRDGDHWLIEVPALHAMTQGRSEQDAYEMLKDLIETMADVPAFEVTVYPHADGRLEVGANDVKILVALLLRRQREKRGISLADAATLLQQKSRNAYARYEQGKAVPTVEKLDELLRAIAPDHQLVWRLG